MCRSLCQTRERPTNTLNSQIPEIGVVPTPLSQGLQRQFPRADALRTSEACTLWTSEVGNLSSPPGTHYPRAQRHVIVEQFCSLLCTAKCAISANRRRGILSAKHTGCNCCRKIARYLHSACFVSPLLVKPYPGGVDCTNRNNERCAASRPEVVGSGPQTRMGGKRAELATGHLRETHARHQELERRWKLTRAAENVHEPRPLWDASDPFPATVWTHALAH